MEERIRRVGSKILSKYMYSDEVRVKRGVKRKVGKLDDYATEYEVVYEGIPCHLAQYGAKTVGHRNDVGLEVTNNLRVNLGIEYDVRENDLLEVERKGKMYKIFAVKVFEYVTHKEIDCRRKEVGSGG